jgi:hypothetical protein
MLRPRLAVSCTQKDENVKRREQTRREAMRRKEKRSDEKRGEAGVLTRTGSRCLNALRV